MIKVKTLQDIEKEDYLFISKQARELIEKRYFKNNKELLIDEDSSILVDKERPVAVLVPLR